MFLSLKCPDLDFEIAINNMILGPLQPKQGSKKGPQGNIIFLASFY